jgi:rifampin ADP-ribosylating transferase
VSAAAATFSQSFFHGFRADLRPGDMICVGHPSNFAADTQLSWYILEARWMRRFGGAELAAGGEIQDASMSSRQPAPG